MWFHEDCNKHFRGKSSRFIYNFQMGDVFRCFIAARDSKSWLAHSSSCHAGFRTSLSTSSRNPDSRKEPRLQYSPAENIFYRPKSQRCKDVSPASSLASSLSKDTITMSLKTYTSLFILSQLQRRSLCLLSRSSKFYSTMLGSLLPSHRS